MSPLLLACTGIFLLFMTRSAASAVPLHLLCVGIVEVCACTCAARLPFFKNSVLCFFLEEDERTYVCMVASISCCRAAGTGFMGVYYSNQRRNTNRLHMHLTLAGVLLKHCCVHAMVLSVRVSLGVGHASQVFCPFYWVLCPCK
uniref:Secreted protein n=1 Tax=Dunaliella tertiolecta TaxID=3047 RepID=A0A7S3QP71_DUNTE